ncbi:glutamate decarboxylase [Arthrobacter silviterrae]|uniref:Glutamate decarboxylase n=1 Tax=Arthrobacter silviterrae TaxID=2026658 RepID=A0ABX0DHR7_9MICC|nr:MULTISPECIES: glutamate decarboxylase [Arthrobacter]MCU6479940.1 glutamate decarboxylase [Arthrobacter sp. A2-55]MDQ0276742.1 glutamate decarboxylase [Arthrobacter silviterrae]NGN84125.1 glutamate decarboxylase [Arthrobacter silviterrae]
MSLHKHHPQHDAIVLDPAFDGGVGSIPKHRLPRGTQDADAAQRFVRDELMLDGNARQNLATFVTTWMEPQAAALMQESLEKNIIDKDEYPQSAEIERRCVNILANLWNAPAPTGGADAVGCSTTGSSEAAMLAGMALKWRWRARREAAGLDTAKPNLVMGANVQVCWEKFARYWDVEARLVPLDGATHLTAAQAAAACDENTIGVVAVLGSTFDGSYEPVAEMAAALDELQSRTGLDVPLHVDAASGGFVAPFLDPELVWDFRLDRVKSINSSGHKYGLVYPGVGWVLWRSTEDLPKDLIFSVDYLGGSMPTFALNFSRPAAQVIAQYYVLVRYGFDGYRRIQQRSRDIAGAIADGVGRLGPFTLLSRGDELPVLAFKLTAPDGWSVYDLSHELRSFGWIVPAYPMPEGMADVDVLRVVVRNGFTFDLAESLLVDMGKCVDRLSGAAKRAVAFHH